MQMTAPEHGPELEALAEPDDPQQRAQAAAARAKEASERAAQATAEAAEAGRVAREAADLATQRKVTVLVGEASALLTDLDAAYQAILDHLEKQTTGVASINSDLQRVLNAGADTQVINYQPDRALSPQDAFKDLAEVLVRRERPRLDPRGLRKDVRYDDLLRPTEEPARGSMTTAEFALARIAHARTRSIHAFYERLVVRISPESVPERASEYVFQELVASFAVHVPPMLIVPHAEDSFGSTVFIRLTRHEGEKPYNLTHDQFVRVEQAFHALGTACVMAGNEQAAAAITEAGNELVRRLRENHRQYRHAEDQHGGIHIRVTLWRDKVAFHLSNSVMEIVRSLMLTSSKGLQFVAVRG
ncbi:hypothetical protein [Rhodanobacter sp. FW106-PBR-LB-2-11]|uniref:hypothetical protein n=1 Tax=Rhodanobacter sp. FW106-PBR-LB-2-11 TaxID=1524463 RepID=UPI0034E57660